LNTGIYGAAGVRTFKYERRHRRCFRQRSRLTFASAWLTAG
jgi:hypothetical protein